MRQMISNNIPKTRLCYNQNHIFPPKASAQLVGRTSRSEMRIEVFRNENIAQLFLFYATICDPRDLLKMFQTNLVV